MTIDQLARQIHRRGVLAALAALALSRPAKAQQFPCAEQGESCTAWVRCCGGTVCERAVLNPNVGVCSGAVFVDDLGDTTDDIVPTCEELAFEWDITGDGTVTCEDFDCQPEAQEFLDLNPSDPCTLDQGGEPGVACEHLADTCPVQSAQAARRRPRRRLRRRRRIRRRLRELLGE